MLALTTFLSANGATILGALFFISEALALIPSVKANSVFTFIFNLLKSKQPPQA